MPTTKPKTKTVTNASVERLGHLNPINRNHIVGKFPKILREAFSLARLPIVTWKDSYMGPTGYIHVQKQDIKGKAVQGIDSHARRFVAFIDKKGHPGVVFQRYNSDPGGSLSNKRWVFNSQVSESIKDASGGNITIHDDGTPSDGFLAAIAAHV